jgi:Zn-dependent protease
VDNSVILERVMMLIPLLLSLTVHEFFHAWTAWRLGDDTAARMGRLTLNPIAHIDPIGTLILPLLGIPFGWAKPVPVNPTRFRRGVKMSTGMILTAAAGPLANVALAVLCAVAFGLVARFSPEAMTARFGIAPLLMIGIQINVMLAIFNMIPIPPLDGSTLLWRFLPPQLVWQWRPILTQYGFIILLLFIFTIGPRVGRLVFDVANFLVGF